MVARHPKDGCVFLTCNHCDFWFEIETPQGGRFQASIRWDCPQCRKENDSLVDIIPGERIAEE